MQEQTALIEAHFGGEWHANVVRCDEPCAWAFSGTDFATLTVTPSLDASKSGNWHGNIIAGEIVGGAQIAKPIQETRVMEQVMSEAPTIVTPPVEPPVTLPPADAGVLPQSVEQNGPAPVTATVTEAPPVAPVVIPASPATALQHVEEWLKDLRTSAPPADRVSIWGHIEAEWHKLVARLEGK